jgi:transmembrane sensor
MDNDTRIITLRTQETVDKEAADWLARLDAGNLSAWARRELRTWLAQDAAHARALKELSALWGDMDLLLNELPAGMGADRNPAGRNSGVRSSATHAPARPGWRFPRLGAALAVVILCVLWFVNQPDVKESTFYVTTVGKQQTINFSDGSASHLNTNSMIETDFTGSKRVVRLLRGEALFDVAHDPQRPFIVYAGDREVMAVGTKFVVRLNSTNVVVTVTDGQVQLSKRKEGAKVAEPSRQQEVILVSKGEEVKITVDDRAPAPKPKEIEPDELNRRFSWLDGQLVFKDERLEQVIAEVSRYLPNRIIIDDPELSNVRISGRFEIGDTDALLEAIEVSFSVKASYTDDQSIRLSR